MDLIKKHFPALTPTQLDQFEKLGGLYKEWNDKINVISRKDIDNIYIHHVLHSLAIGKVMHFKKDTQILDLGTGGGFPGIPLAILFPEVHFTLIDGTNKKIKVVNAVAQSLELNNATGVHIRAEEVKDKYDFVVTRAVALVEKLVHWSLPLIHNKHRNTYPNGIIALKGGDVKKEVAAANNKIYSEIFPIRNWFDNEYFDEKNVVYIQR